MIETDIRRWPKRGLKQHEIEELQFSDDEIEVLVVRANWSGNRATEIALYDDEGLSLYKIWWRKWREIERVEKRESELIFQMVERAGIFDRQNLCDLPD